MNKDTPEELQRYRPKTEENDQIRATRFLDLCKSCGECVMKCPVNAISWDEKDLGQLGEPGIVIDLDKCIGCEICERVCPDSAIQITNKRLEKPKWQKGLFGWIVEKNAYWLEKAVTTFHAPKSRLDKVGRTKKKTPGAWVLRTLLRYRKSPVRKYYRDRPKD